MAGMMATSARPNRKSSAHCEGTVNDRSYFAWSGPLVKPQTSGAVFRYCTMEMRSLLTKRVSPSRSQYNRDDFRPRPAAGIWKDLFALRVLNELTDNKWQLADSGRS